MQKRPLGRSGLEIAPLVLGGNVFDWTADEAQSFAILDAFIGAGFNCIDTADVYSRWVPGHTGGESEVVIGNWLAARGGRDKVIIATKFGAPMADDKKGLSRAYMMQAVEASLTRLKTDYIDLYQSHFDDPEAPQDEVAEGFARLVEQGKARAIGASNFTADRLASALKAATDKGLPRYESLQPQYNLADRDRFEGDAAGPVRQGGRGGHLLLRSGVGLPHRQVPLGGRPRQEPARPRRQALPRCARPSHPGVAG